MARPARQEQTGSARSSHQLIRFYRSINPDRVFGTHTWTPDDIRTLKSMAQNYPTKQIAAQLGRASSAIVFKAHKLKISLRLTGGALAPSAAAPGTNCLGTPRSRFRRVAASSRHETGQLHLLS